MLHVHVAGEQRSRRRIEDAMCSAFPRVYNVFCDAEKLVQRSRWRNWSRRDATRNGERGTQESYRASMDSVAFVFLAAALLEKQRICAWEALKIDAREMYSLPLNGKLENVPSDAKSCWDFCEFRLSSTAALESVSWSWIESRAGLLKASHIFRCSHAVEP